MKKTKFFNQAQREWLLIDAKDRILGRLSTRIAKILQGKHKAVYSPNFLCGDRVIVVNAKYIRVTGDKLNQKMYDKYSGYPSGRREINLKELQSKNPSKVIYYAVKGMLPKSTLGKQMLKSLSIYEEGEHKHQGQQPKKIEV